MFIAVTGTLSIKRADFVSLIEENGGIYKSSITKNVTHLVAARDDTAKFKKAKEKLLKIVKEDDIMELVLDPKNSSKARGSGSLD